MYNNQLYSSELTPSESNQPVELIFPSRLCRPSAPPLVPSYSCLYNFVPTSNNHLTPHSSLIKLVVSVAGHKARALVDCGATTNFIDSTFVSSRSIPTLSISQPVFINLGDGSQRATTAVTPQLAVNVASHSSQLALLIVPLSGCDIVLGMPWLADVNPRIDWAAKTLRFNTHSLANNNPTSIEQVAEQTLSTHNNSIDCSFAAAHSNRTPVTPSCNQSLPITFCAAPASYSTAPTIRNQQEEVSSSIAHVQFDNNNSALNSLATSTAAKFNNACSHAANHLCSFAAHRINATTLNQSTNTTTIDSHQQQIDMQHTNQPIHLHQFAHAATQPNLIDNRSTPESFRVINSSTEPHHQLVTIAASCPPLSPNSEQFTPQNRCFSPVHLNNFSPTHDRSDKHVLFELAADAARFLPHQAKDLDTNSSTCIDSKSIQASISQFSAHLPVAVAANTIHPNESASSFSLNNRSSSTLQSNQPLNSRCEQVNRKIEAFDRIPANSLASRKVNVKQPMTAKTCSISTGNHLNSFNKHGTPFNRRNFDKKISIGEKVMSDFYKTNPSLQTRMSECM